MAGSSVTVLGRVSHALRRATVAPAPAVPAMRASRSSRMVLNGVRRSGVSAYDGVDVGLCL